MTESHSETIQLAQALITRASVTPTDLGCQALMMKRLKKLRFHIETLNHGEVQNFWARTPHTGPVFCFAGHTDVVPTGPEEAWTYPPFSAQTHHNCLYGRGAADMKGSLAAMITATERFLKQHPQPQGAIAFLITSDEEGPAVHGTQAVVKELIARGETIDWCLVGEPSSKQQLGDQIKNGRRGSLSGELKIWGTQGHIAYPHLADNPIHHILPALQQLGAHIWDRGNDHFPATSFQISNIHAGTGVGNMIPGELSLNFNFRFSSAITATELQQAVIGILDNHQLRYELHWQLFGEPYLTVEGDLIQATRQAIYTVTGHKTTLATDGGTSDGRFIARMGGQVLEFGPCNATIHQVNEHVKLQDLESLSQCYEHILKLLLAPEDQ